MNPCQHVDMIGNIGNGQTTPEIVAALMVGLIARTADTAE